MVRTFQHALITGGSSGIGKAIAAKLAARGTRVSLLARGLATLDTARAEIAAVSRASEPRVTTRATDVADAAATEAAIAEVVEAAGPPDLLVTSAGIARPGMFEDVPLEVFERTMAVNYFGTLHAVRAVLPHMRRSGSGHIAMISSGAGLIGLYGYTPYSPTKFAVRGLAESLRGELKPHGIGVTIAYPPDTDTPQLAAENQTKPEATKRITGAAKVWSAEAVADVILHGIDRNRFSVAPGFELGFLDRFHSVVAPAVRAYMDAIVRRTGA